MKHLFERRLRVPFAASDAAIRPSISPMVGERFQVNIDISELVLPALAEEAIAAALRHVAYDISEEVRTVVSAYLHDPARREWIQQTIETEVRSAVAMHVAALLSRV